MPEMKSKDKPARAVGFDVASCGPDAVRQSLRDLTYAIPKGDTGTGKAFGRLGRWLAHDAAQDDRCDVYRDLLRDVILETWAIPAGEVVLGKTLPVRKLHSVASASIEIQRSMKTVRQILKHAKIIEDDDHRSDTRIVFDAAHAAATLAQAKRLVIAKDMAQRLGASSGQFESLVRQNIIRPVFPAEVSKFQWDTADADALLATLTRDAITIADDDECWISIGVAAMRARIEIRDALDAISTGRLRVGSREGQHGYAAICVRQTDMDQFGLGRPEHPTLSEFGQQVGLQKDGSINALFKAGQVQATMLFNPATRRTGLYMTDEDRAAFHVRFTTLKLLLPSLQIGSRVLARKLQEAGVERFSPNGEDFGWVYLVDDVKGVLPKIGSS